MRAVLDTNVVVALLVFGDPRLDELAWRWRTGSVIPLVDDETLAEFERVLRYPVLKRDENAARSLGADYRARSTLVPPAAFNDRTLPHCRDRDDQKFLQLAQRAGADLLLTRDKALLRLRGRTRFTIATPDSVQPG